MVEYNQFVSYICPYCSMLIHSTSQKWQERVMIPSEREGTTQYAHKKCFREEQGHVLDDDM